MSKEEREQEKAQRLQQAAEILREAIERIDKELDCTVSPFAQIADGRIVADIQLIAR